MTSEDRLWWQLGSLYVPLIMRDHDGDLLAVKDLQDLILELTCEN